MFFLFGWGRQTNKDFGPTLPMDCPNCHNEAYWHLHQSTRWFTFFFLPVFPYASKYFLACEVCSRGIEVSGARIAPAKRLNRAAQAFFANRMTEEQFHSAVDESHMLS